MTKHLIEEWLPIAVVLNQGLVDVGEVRHGKGENDKAR